MKGLFRQVLGTAPNGDGGQETAYQIIRFSCERCGIPAQARVSPAILGSGFAIGYQAYKSSNRYFLRVRKYGAGNRGTTAGLVDNADFHTVEIK